MIPNPHVITRPIDPEVLKKSHVVITTYTTLSSEHASFAPKAKDESAKAKKKSKPDEEELDSDSSEENFGRTLEVKKKKRATKVKDALFRVKWWRVVLGMICLQVASLKWWFNVSLLR